MKKRLLVDMDGVLADIYEQFIAYEYRDTGTQKSTKEAVGKNEFIVFPNGKNHIHEPGFFRTAPVISHSQEVLEELNNKYNVYIVSSATEFPKSLSEKQAWLNEHFPFIGWQQMIFCGSKIPICGDWMIDDMFKNLDGFNGQGILFTQPHNQLSDAKEHLRVNDWLAIRNLLI